jgi:hypothetical protein
MKEEDKDRVKREKDDCHVSDDIVLDNAHKYNSINRPREHHIQFFSLFQSILRCISCE